MCVLLMCMPYSVGQQKLRSSEQRAQSSWYTISLLSGKDKAELQDTASYLLNISNAQHCFFLKLYF